MAEEIEHKDLKSRLAEEALLESEERYRTLIETTQDLIYTTDRKGFLTYLNPTLERALGYTPNELNGKSFAEIVAPDHIDRLRDIFRRSLKGESIPVYEADLIRKDGANLPVEFNVTTLLDKEGKPTGRYGIGRDITGRKRAEEALKESEEKYRSIVGNAQEGIYQTTPEGRYIMVNPAMAKMFGYRTPEELMTSVTDVARQVYVNPEERMKVREMIEEKGFIKNYESQFYRKDGSIFWVSLTMRVVRDEKGQILYYEGMNEDITERKESIERIRKSLGATVQAIAVTVETRDPYTAGHQRRVADLARAIATEMNLPTDQIDGIRMAGVIHDLGKISVPADILSKPAKLTALEFGIIKTHAQSGHDILKDVEFPWPIARMVLEHHERMDGSGYPNGLTGENLLVESQILSVADVVEAMASHRPYRPALGIDAALKEIENNKGTLYDTGVVDACLRLFRENGYQLIKGI